MKARITLPSGAVVEVDSSPEEIRRLAGESGYKLELLPMDPPALCICGHAYVTLPMPVCPVHGGRFRMSWRPLPPIASSGAAMSWGTVLA